MQQTLHLPNPQDWADARQAMMLLNVARPTLYAMVRDGRVGDYKIGTMRVFWRPDLEEVAAAMRRLKKS